MNAGEVRDALVFAAVMLFVAPLALACFGMAVLVVGPLLVIDKLIRWMNRKDPRHAAS